MHIPDGVVVDGETVPGFVEDLPGGMVGVPADTVDGVVPNKHRLHQFTHVDSQTV